MFSSTASAYQRKNSGRRGSPRRRLPRPPWCRLRASRRPRRRRGPVRRALSIGRSRRCRRPRPARHVRRVPRGTRGVRPAAPVSRLPPLEEAGLPPARGRGGRGGCRGGSGTGGGGARGRGRRAGRGPDALRRRPPRAPRTPRRLRSAPSSGRFRGLCRPREGSRAGEEHLRTRARRGARPGFARRILPRQRHFRPGGHPLPSAGARREPAPRNLALPRLLSSRRGGRRVRRGRGPR